MFPADNRSAMMPEPTTAATSSPVPEIPRRVEQADSISLTANIVEFFLDFQLVNTGQGEAQKQTDSALKE